MKTRILVGLLLVSLALTAQAKKPWEEYGERIKAQESIGILGEDLFGDTVNYQDGALSFSAIDISLPGNSSLPVQLKRTFSASGRTNAAGYDEAFADWELDLPRLSGVFAPTWQNNRCSNVAAPLSIGNYTPDQYWNGNTASMPSGGEMLGVTNSVPAVPKPTSGGPYLWMTPQFTYFSCLTTIKNGPGEGFLAITPDGTKYWFDSLAQYAHAQVDSPVSPGSFDVPLQRKRNVLYATRVEDRFGNWVTYTYTNAAGAPAKLTSIQANDGRVITLTYNAKGQIATASNGSQTWTYQYSYPNNYTNTLSAVILPDTRKWQFNFLPFSTAYFDYDADIPRRCEMTAPFISNDPVVGTITHPSGALGQFEVRATKHGRANVPMACANYTISGAVNDKSDDVAFWPRTSDMMSLSKKIISGPGISAAQWDFYTGSAGSWADGTGPTCQTSTCGNPVCLSDSCAGPGASTTVVGPTGQWKRYTFGNSYRYNEGKLLKLESGTGPTGILETQTYTYEYAQSGQNFAIPIGASLPARGDGFTSASLRPEKVRTIVKDGVTYTSTVNVFDSFARSTDVTRSNSNGFSKTERMVYADNTSKWVVGQLASQTDVATNQIEQSNTYDVNANLFKKYAFGVLQETYTYNLDGTLATVTDNKTNKYTLSSWKRGIPQSIKAPDDTIQSGVVNDSGWLTSVTIQRGKTPNFTYDTTGYTYDAMGRLTGVTPPTGDTVAWAGTTLSFAPLTTATFGVPAGGWLHSISRGNYRKETYMDALYRPLVIREYDNANATGTRRFTVKAYDTSNREVFSSYPGISSGLTLGTRTTYDALGRVIENKADSELGTLTTTTQYLTGGGIKVTGPDGNVTTRTFRSLDAPSYDQMISESAPGGVTTTISRDVFGKPLTITRSGSDGLNISKQFAYDTNQRLCMRTEPETGTSIIDYDAAGNVLWAANGQAVANPAACSRTNVSAASKITYTYDKLNRVTKTDDPSSTTNDPTVTYLADGAIDTLKNGTATWTYTYNKLGKPVTESLNLGGKISTITHAYDTLANEASLTYPNATVVSYAPNALGQATQAGTYATGMTYRASGFLTAMTYGNGATYSAQPNLRGLPARRLDKKGTTVITDELMAYDQDANPVCVRDSTTGNPGSRDFTYDARDRLIKASAPNQAWISSEYQYDSQDNIKMARLGTRQYNYSYDANNRLLDIGQPATAPVATNFGLLSCADYSLLTDLGSGGAAGTLTITTLTLPDGRDSSDYGPVTLTATGGTAPYTFAITAGKLPLGLSISGNTITGTPVRIETQVFTITTTDSYGSTGSRSFMISIVGGGGGGGGGGVPLSITPMLLAGDTLKYNFTHDPQGRMTAKKTLQQEYFYDALNRMTKVNGKESYLYDGHGRRVQVTNLSNNAINYPIYGLDGKLLLEDNRQTLTRTEYIYANNRLIAKRIQPITSLGADNGAATVTTIHTDFLGSPVAETNSTGTVSRVERYTPYGEPSDMALDAGPGFTGHATDVATGLTYMQQRYYDPDIGRFISPDPVGPEEDFVNHFNRYKYALNNPVAYTDPDGQADASLFMKGEPLEVTARRFDIPGWFTLMGHGGYGKTSVYGFRDDRKSTKLFDGPRLTSAKSVANFIKSNGFDKSVDKGVFMGQCQGAIFAVGVASELGTQVMATNGYVSTIGNKTSGDITYKAYSNHTSDGRPAGPQTTFNVYQSDGKVTASYSSITQKEDGSVWGRRTEAETGTRYKKLDRLK